MRDALPNASFIGFTGTPIELTDKNTRAVFGDYISVYDIQRAVEDKATVPIYYESRLAKLELDEAERPKIDPDFEEATEGEEVDRREKLKSKWAQLESVVGAGKRVKLIAQDIVDHFEIRAEAMLRQTQDEGKAMLVCMDSATTEVLFTGYYQPVIDGSLVRTEKFRYPVYGRPADLIIAEQVLLKPQLSVEKIVGRAEGEDFLPYYTRREIDQESRLEGRGLEIAWVADPIELFFLHIQGSGTIRLPDGTQLKIGYAGQNGWPYRSIGRLLIENGKHSKDEMSMQRLRRYLRENSQEQSEIFNANPSYIFFRLNPAGPMGSLEVPVTAERSLATDSRLFPQGALVLVSTEIPVVSGSGELTGWRAVTRFMLNQDTGGAIRGPQRADIYFGADEMAANLAGYMEIRDDAKNRR